MKGVIFDLDGTMVDNMMVHHRAWQQKLKSMGMNMSLEEVMLKAHGINEEILERLFGDRYTPEERRQHSFEKEEMYRTIFRDRLRLIEGLPVFLNELSSNNIPMAIGSAAPPENVDFVLDGLQIRNHFQAICHARNVTRGKPHPEIYLKVADQLNLNPEECVVFEDSPTGAEAAMRAGCPLVVITTTHDPDEFARFPNVIRFEKNYNDLTLQSLVNGVSLR